MNFAVYTIYSLMKKTCFNISNLSGLYITAVLFVISLSAAELPSTEQTCANESQSKSAKIPTNCRDLDFFADLIVWTAREAAADCWAEVITSDTSSSFNELEEVHFGWDPGFRVGLGFGVHHDQWNTRAYYTRFHTRGKDSISKKPGTVHSTFLGNFYVDNASGAGLSGPSYQKASINWTIHFNMFDLELGRNFWINKWFTIYPFLDVKVGWIHQFINSKWENPDLIAEKFYNIGRENLKNNFWGIGPGVGINTKWNLFSNQNRFYLFGDFFGALMWGHWSFSDIFENDLKQQVSVDLNKIKSGASMVRTFMGLGWDVNLRQNRCHFSTKLGYEMQFWLDQLQFYSFTGGRLSNALTLQGGTLEFYFGF